MKTRTESAESLELYDVVSDGDEERNQKSQVQNSHTEVSALLRDSQSFLQEQVHDLAAQLKVVEQTLPQEETLLQRLEEDSLKLESEVESFKGTKKVNEGGAEGAENKASAEPEEEVTQSTPQAEDEADLDKLFSSVCEAFSILNSLEDYFRVENADTYEELKTLRQICVRRNGESMYELLQEEKTEVIMDKFFDEERIRAISLRIFQEESKSVHTRLDKTYQELQSVTQNVERRLQSVGYGVTPTEEKLLDRLAVWVEKLERIEETIVDDNKLALIEEELERRISELEARQETELSTQHYTQQEINEKLQAFEEKLNAEVSKEFVSVHHYTTEIKQLSETVKETVKDVQEKEADQSKLNIDLDQRFEIFEYQLEKKTEENELRECVVQCLGEEAATKREVTEMRAHFDEAMLKFHENLSVQLRLNQRFANYEEELTYMASKMDLLDNAKFLEQNFLAALRRSEHEMRASHERLLEQTTFALSQLRIEVPSLVLKHLTEGAEALIEKTLTKMDLGTIEKQLSFLQTEIMARPTQDQFARLDSQKASCFDLNHLIDYLWQFHYKAAHLNQQAIAFMKQFSPEFENTAINTRNFEIEKAIQNLEDIKTFWENDQVIPRKHVLSSMQRERFEPMHEEEIRDTISRLVDREPSVTPVVRRQQASNVKGEAERSHSVLERATSTLTATIATTSATTKRFLGTVNRIHHARLKPLVTENYTSFLDTLTVDTVSPLTNDLRNASMN